MILESIGGIEHTALAATKQPPAATRSLQQSRGSLARTRGKIARRPLVLERKDDLSVTIADDGIGGRLAITRFKLAYRLADHGAADFAAADNGEHVIKIR